MRPEWDFNSQPLYQCLLHTALATCATKDGTPCKIWEWLIMPRLVKVSELGNIVNQLNIFLL